MDANPTLPNPNTKRIGDTKNMYNTKTITIGEDTITNNTETHEIIRNDETIHHFCIRGIDENYNILTQKGNTYKTITPYYCRLTLPQLAELCEAYKEEETKETKKAQKKISKATVKGKKTQKKEEDADDKKEE